MPGCSTASSSSPSSCCAPSDLRTRAHHTPADPGAPADLQRGARRVRRDGMHPRHRTQRSVPGESVPECRRGLDTHHFDLPASTGRMVGPRHLWLAGAVPAGRRPRYRRSRCGSPHASLSPPALRQHEARRRQPGPPGVRSAVQSSRAQEPELPDSLQPARSTRSWFPSQRGEILLSLWCCPYGRRRHRLGYPASADS